MPYIAAAAATVVGLFGGMMLLAGVLAIADGVHHWRHLDDGYVVEMAIPNLIGALSAFFAIRWFRSAIKGTARAFNKWPTVASNPEAQGSDEGVSRKPVD